jgi:Family of unknown function (DUF6941)
MQPTGLDPERGMKVTLMLADAAQVAEGKLHVLGAGWTVTGPQPVPFAIAGIIEVPWHQTNRQHTFRLELIDLDGNAVLVETPEGEQPLFIEGQFEVGRPPGIRSGASIPFPFAVSHGGAQLPTGSHLEWRLTVNGQAHEDWRLAFSTRPDAQSQAA